MTTPIDHHAVRLGSPTHSNAPVRGTAGRTSAFGRRSAAVARSGSESGLRAAATSRTIERVLRALRSNHFAVLSTVDADGWPDSAAVSYGAGGGGNELQLYVMTRRHLKKARNIAHNPRVSLVVPVPRRVLGFIPPATLQLRGRAEILDWSDPEGTGVFHSFWMGRRILELYERSRRRGDNRVCFLRITLDPVVGFYALGRSVWHIRQRMESSGGKVDLSSCGADAAD